jgi:hypothetical protein
MVAQVVLVVLVAAVLAGYLQMAVSRNSKHW